MYVCAPWLQARQGLPFVQNLLWILLSQHIFTATTVTVASAERRHSSDIYFRLYLTLFILPVAKFSKILWSVSANIDLSLVVTPITRSTTGPDANALKNFPSASPHSIHKSWTNCSRMDHHIFGRLVSAQVLDTDSLTALVWLHPRLKQQPHQKSRNETKDISTLQCSETGLDSS